MNAAPLEAVSMAMDSMGENNTICMIYLSFLSGVRVPSIFWQLESINFNPENKQAK
jgi:hypothetical protein